MNKILMLIPLLMACSTAPKAKHRYQDHFWVGCMNGYIHQAEKDGVTVDENFLHNAYDWCMKSYEDIENSTKVVHIK